MTRTAPIETQPDDYGCGCVPAPAEPNPVTLADMMQARAIAAGLAEFGIGPSRWSTAYDIAAASVVLRLDTPRGLYALGIPEPGQAFPVYHQGERIGALDCRRTHGTADSLTAVRFAAYLRDRAALDIPRRDVLTSAKNMV